MAVNDVYRVEIHQNVGSEPTMNVLHLREATTETILANPAVGVTELVTDLYTALAADLSEDWRVIMINTRRVSPLGGIPYSLVLGGAESIVGAVASEIVPAQAAILASLYTNTGDRTGRGRMYLPGCPEDAQNEGQLLEARWLSLQNNFTNWFTLGLGPATGGDGTYRAMVFGGGASPDPAWDVMAVAVRPNLATQRRRRAFPGFGA